MTTNATNPPSKSGKLNQADALRTTMTHVVVGDVVLVMTVTADPEGYYVPAPGVAPKRAVWATVTGTNLVIGVKLENGRIETLDYTGHTAITIKDREISMATGEDAHGVTEAPDDLVAADGCRPVDEGGDSWAIGQVGCAGDAESWELSTPQEAVDAHNAAIAQYGATPTVTVPSGRKDEVRVSPEERITEGGRRSAEDALRVISAEHAHAVPTERIAGDGIPILVEASQGPGYAIDYGNVGLASLVEACGMLTAEDVADLLSPREAAEAYAAGRPWSATGGKRKASSKITKKTRQRVGGR